MQRDARDNAAPIREVRITNSIIDPAADIVAGRRVVLAPDVEHDVWVDRLTHLDVLLADARRVHASHSAVVDVVEWDDVAVAIKRVPARTTIQRLGDRYQGSPARRALTNGLYLQQHGIGTPRPIAVVEEGSDGSSPGSLLLTEWLGAHVSFKDALVELLAGDGEAPAIVELLREVAGAIRAMHDAGFYHRDLGNQNILLQRDVEGRFHAPVFIDLNRGRAGAEVSLRQRGFDLSRIYLPSDLLRIFQELYFDARPPRAFRRAEARCRRRFAFHTATRAWRHPLRTWRQEAVPRDDYPSPRDLWLWDPASVQPVAALRSRDRRRLMPKRDWGRVLLATLRQAPAVKREARRLAADAFTVPVEMAGRLGVALSERPELVAFEDACLEELGDVHLLARFYAHQAEEQWNALAARLERLHAIGHAITVVLVQDRRAVKDLSRWRTFVRYVLQRVGTLAEDVQVGQAVNRTKWGIWTVDEYAALVQVVADVARVVPDVRLIGPSVIDFEPHCLVGMLDRLPPGTVFGGVGHLLYVDRRGAPENRQGPYDTVGKLAVLRAVAHCSVHTADRLIVTETNWPLEGTGISSPICSPYLYSGQTVAGGVDELTYGYYMIRYLLMALCSGLAERVFWWRLTAHGFGLVDDKDSSQPRKRPAYAMLKQFAQWVLPATFSGRLESAPGVHAYGFKGGPLGAFTMAYAEAGAADRNLSRAFDKAIDSQGRTLEHFTGELPADGAPVYLIG